MLERFWRGCGDCRNGDGCARGGSAGAAVDPPGVWTAVLVFLVPLAMGICGAWLGGAYTLPGSSAANVCQAAGLIAGFAVGVAAARLVLAGACRLRRRSEAKP